MVADCLPFQFIHESVRQHRLKSGLTALLPGLSYEVETCIHTVAAEWCQDYILSCDAVSTDFPVDATSGMMACETLARAHHEDVHQLVDEAFPFLFYACK